MWIRNPDMGTYSILETAAHFELLIAAELAPRCWIGVAPELAHALNCYDSQMRSFLFGPSSQLVVVEESQSLDGDIVRHEVVNGVAGIR